MDDDKVNILVVDDLPEKLLVYHSILDELEQNIVTARTGSDALKQVLQRDFAVILLDVNMPDMDGFETASLIRARKKSAHTPILFVTAYLDEVRAVQGYAHGAVDYILAPVAPEVLRAKVAVFVDLFRMNQQLKRQAEERVTLAMERARREAAEEANRNSAFLVEASGVLNNSLDLDTTLRGLVRLMVPFLGDLSMVHLAGDPGCPMRSEWAWIDPDRKMTTVPLSLSPPAPDWLARGMQRVLEGGRTEMFQPPETGAMELDLGPASPTTMHLESALVLPLCARGKTLGALALGSVSGKFSPSKLALVEDLAARAGIAIDNALLVQNIQDADRRKDEFLAMLAHELRNPLAPLSNAIQVMRFLGLPHPEIKQAHEMMERQVRHLTRLVDDLLDVSRITTGKIRLQIEAIDVGTAVNAAVETNRPLISARKQELHLTLPREPLRVKADMARLAQILANLLNNAAKYTPDGGNIWLSVEREGNWVKLRVRDDGVGIAADILPRVFDLFTQADRSLDRAQGGLGIGLTLVHRLVEIHHGTVQAFSAGLGQGSEFVVRLPVLTEETHVEPSRNGNRPAKVKQAKLRVLVVDDNVDAADSQAMIVVLEGHESSTAHNGTEALKAFVSFHPDVVLLDIGLPGMDGFEVCRQLRQLPECRSVTLAAITGYGTDADRARSRQAGFDHHLVKPISLEDLRAVLVSAQSRLGLAAAKT